MRKAERFIFLRYLNQLSRVERLQGWVKAFGQLVHGASRFCHDERVDRSEQTIQHATVETTVDLHPWLNQHK